MKLYHKLNILSENNVCSNRLCCNAELDEDDFNYMDDCVLSADDISNEEASSLYYICGYVCKKCDLGSKVIPENCPNSEFTELVSRGSLTYPNDNMFQIARFLCMHYSNYYQRTLKNTNVPILCIN